ncbi:hypothetical protein [Caballeronia sp. NCTM1]|uniref:hypothetical protein n=1 Tax=Caballeronia sp. NCTM1 TaxID=2921753 RepID=UPI0020292797|nr:hypothetical protein [Caballeronia sp. NCTM1]
MIALREHCGGCRHRLCPTLTGVLLRQQKKRCLAIKHDDQTRGPERSCGAAHGNRLAAAKRRQQVHPEHGSSSQRDADDLLR